MITQAQFRDLALGFPGSAQGSHFDVTDFRVGGKIFATLRESDGRAVLKLSHDEQQLLMTTSSQLFQPVKGSWGAKGWTRVILDQADEATIRHAMTMAWKSVAPAKKGGRA
jgi:predicted DNA-binding protein (MmcQ/YjbR family)